MFYSQYNLPYTLLELLPMDVVDSNIVYQLIKNYQFASSPMKELTQSHVFLVIDVFHPEKNRVKA